MKIVYKEIQRIFEDSNAAFSKMKYSNWIIAWHTCCRMWNNERSIFEFQPYFRNLINKSALVIFISLLSIDVILYSSNVIKIHEIPKFSWKCCHNCFWNADGQKKNFQKIFRWKLISILSKISLLRIYLWINESNSFLRYCQFQSSFSFDKLSKLCLNLKLSFLMCFAVSHSLFFQSYMDVFHLYFSGFFPLYWPYIACKRCFLPSYTIWLLLDWFIRLICLRVFKMTYWIPV